MKSFLDFVYFLVLANVAIMGALTVGACLVIIFPHIS